MDEAAGLEALKSLAAHNSALEASLAESSSIIAELCTRRTELAQRHEATQEALRGEKEAHLEKQGQVRLLEASCADLERSSSEALRAAEEASLRADSLAEAKAHLDGVAARLTREGDELRGKLVEAEGLVSKLRAELLDKSAMNDAAEQQLAELRTQAKGAEAKQQVLGEMWETRARLEDEVQKLTERLNGAYAQVTTLQAELETKTTKVSELERQLAAASAGSNAKDGEAADLRWRCDAAEEALATLQSQAKALLEKKDAQMKSMDADFARARKENGRLEHELQEAHSANGDLRSQCAALASRTEKAEARMNDELAARKKEGKRANAAERRVKELEAELAGLKGDLQKAKDGMGMMRTIAKIRGDDEREGCRAVGFDAVGERTMDAVSGKSKRGAGRRR